MQETTNFVSVFQVSPEVKTDLKKIAIFKWL